MGSAQYLDPYDFDNDDSVESQESGLDSSLLELLRQGSCSSGSSSSDEEEFSGFTREQIYLSRGSRVHSFHQRPGVSAQDPQVRAHKENDPEQQESQSFPVSQSKGFLLFKITIFSLTRKSWHVVFLVKENLSVLLFLHMQFSVSR